MSEVTLGSPTAGIVFDIDKVPDPVFASEMMGPSVALQVTVPVSCGDDGRSVISSPIAGKLIALKTHGFVVRSKEGFGVLVHLGVDTYEDGDSLFSPLTAQGAFVKTGDPIISWDVPATEALGHSALLLLTVLDGELSEVAPTGSLVAVRSPLGLARTKTLLGG